MRVLGIETSCDETGVAIYDGELGLMAHALYSQAEIHAEYGGVVPEIASRDHVRKILPLIDQCLSQAGCSREDIDGIAYTAGPGLIGALLVGASVGQSIALAMGIPAVGVHHMEGHVLAPLLEPDPPRFPFVALLVSGGHTMLIEVAGLGQYRLMGETLDDAAGEAFDKTAKLLGLGYPGGPALARCAEQGDPARYPFPRPMTDRPGLDFSFSGLKTHTRNLWEQNQSIDNAQADIAAGFQEAVVDTLVIKCRRAMKEARSGQLVIAGGVGANLVLRSRLKQAGRKHGWEVAYPRIEFCTDNGAMIALAGYHRLLAQSDSHVGQAPDHSVAGTNPTAPAADIIHARPRWPMDELVQMGQGLGPITSTASNTSSQPRSGKAS